MDLAIIFLLWTYPKIRYQGSLISGSRSKRIFYVRCPAMKSIYVWWVSSYEIYLCSVGV
uniref:Uncharacterized protein n=1 Tax=Picea glauca TaxID=3330 RepID=A0A124GMI9_PICGL|nr:hypothetical protein ABT39_MTgene2171 [Picea glauca]